jgi:hypothetical protein
MLGIDMKENYRGYMLEYSWRRGDAPGEYILSASATPPSLRGQVPKMYQDRLATAKDDTDAALQARAEAHSLVDNIAPHVFSQVDLASHQLDRALVLFFEEGDYLSALTLAHAAYGILLGCGAPTPKPNSLERLADRLVAIAPFGGALTRSKVINWLNAPVNALKHPTRDRRPSPMPFEGSIVANAADRLDLAVEEAFRVTGRETSGMRQFREWASAQSVRPSAAEAPAAD